MVGYPIAAARYSTDSKWAGLAALSLAGVFGSLGGSVGQAMVADLVAPERHEAAYASVRVAANLGVVIGPPIGGLLLVLGSWSALFPTVAVLSAIAWLVAFRYLPAARRVRARGAARARLAGGRSSRDRPFLLFLGSAVFAWLVYVAYEIVLPVSIVDGFGYERVRLGLHGVDQPAARDAVPAAADAARRAGAGRAEARRRDARHGAAVRPARRLARALGDPRRRSPCS